MSFLPKGYEVPKSPSAYLKLEDGQNKLRFMSAPIMGYVYWNTDNKPVRMRMHQRPDGRPADQREDDKLKHFWALVVWNYREARLQVFEMTQASIQGPIQD